MFLSGLQHFVLMDNRVAENVFVHTKKQPIDYIDLNWLVGEKLITMYTT